MRLSGKTALVTSGASTIGRAICLHFAREGARVMVVDPDHEAAVEVAEAVLEAGGEASATACDVTQEDQVQSMVGDAIVAFGSLEVLVNAAAHRVRGDFLTLDRDEWQKAVAINLESVWLCTRYAAPFLKASGRGAVVHITSTHALRSMPKWFAYATTKGAVLSANRSMAIDLGPQGIRSNVVVTGYIESAHNEEELREAVDPERDFRRILGVHPLGRTGTPKDVAKAASFLASDDASFITGTSLIVDGGRSAVIQDMHDWGK